MPVQDYSLQHYNEIAHHIGEPKKPEPTLAISIRQPWAWLILNGGKDIENRSWPTKVRGRVLIHAAKGMTMKEYDEAMEWAHLSGAIKGDIDSPEIQSLELGGIVGEVEIVDCVTSSTSKWFTGVYGFVLRNPKPLPFRPCKGALGFFTPRF